MKGVNMLHGVRVYLSGPMDYIAERQGSEAEDGWRRRVGDILTKKYGAIVFTPWNKPPVRGVGPYGREGEEGQDYRKNWTFESGERGSTGRALCSEKAWPMVHIDLRMVDTSDFVIAYCPTNVYSVGTVHEIVVARQQKKPVLFVTPPVSYPALAKLEQHLAADRKGSRMLKDLNRQAALKENETGAPSSWYMGILDTETVFDGFGFTETLAKRYRWNDTELGKAEHKSPPKRPLLAFLDQLNRGDFSRKWRSTGDSRRNDDWLLWVLESSGSGQSLADVNTPSEESDSRRSPRSSPKTRK